MNITFLGMKKYILVQNQIWFIFPVKRGESIAGFFLCVLQLKEKYSFKSRPQEI